MNAVIELFDQGVRHLRKPYFTVVRYLVVMAMLGAFGLVGGALFGTALRRGTGTQFGMMVGGIFGAVFGLVLLLYEGTFLGIHQPMPISGAKEEKPRTATASPMGKRLEHIFSEDLTSSELGFEPKKRVHRGRPKKEQLQSRALSG